jgi:hypothetical protein
MTKTNKTTSGRRGRTAGSYSTQSVKLSELIEKLDPSSSIPINVRFCRIKNLTGELLEATANNLKKLADSHLPKQTKLETNQEISNSNNVETEIPAAQAA